MPNYIIIVGHGGALVETTPVVGSNPALAAMYRDLGQVLYLQLPVALRRVNSDTVSILLWSGALLKGAGCEKRYRNG